MIVKNKCFFFGFLRLLMDNDEESSERYYSSKSSSHFTNKRIVDFTKEIRCQLYGFGDDPNPYTETVSTWLIYLSIEYLLKINFPDIFIFFFRFG